MDPFWWHMTGIHNNFYFLIRSDYKLCLTIESIYHGRILWYYSSILYIICHDQTLLITPQLHQSIGLPCSVIFITHQAIFWRRYILFLFKYKLPCITGILSFHWNQYLMTVKKLQYCFKCIISIFFQDPNLGVG